MRRALAALALALAAASAQAEFERPALAEPLFEGVAESEQLGHVVVAALVADPQGFLWIGSAAGLARFDGHEIQSLNLPLSDPAVGSRVFVRTLLWSRAGRLWVGTDHEGLSAYDPQQQRWTVYAPPPAGRFVRGAVRALAEDAEGHIWAATMGDGLQRLDPASGAIEAFGEAQGLHDARVQTLRFDRAGGLWVGTWSGLAYRAPGARQFVRAPGELALPGSIVTALFEDPLGRLWVGTQRGELLRWTPGEGRLEWLDRGESRFGAVQALALMDEGEIWLGRAQGVEIRRLTSGSLVRALRPRANRPAGLNGNDVRTLVRDPAGVLWLGSFGGGLQRHVPNRLALWVRQVDSDEDSVLGRVDVRSLLARANGEIWAGTAERGVAVLDTELRVLRQLQAPGCSGQPIGALAQAPDGSVWVGCDERVSVWSGTAWQRTLTLGKGRVRRLLITPEGAVFAGTQDGLYRWRAGEPGFTRLTLQDGTLLKGSVNALLRAGDGRLWLGGERGLHTLASGADAVQAPAGDRARLSQDVLGLTLDATQQLWVDLPSGLHRLRAWDGQRAELQPVEAVNQRTGGSFGANLLFDTAGRLWTQSGVFDPVSEQYEPLRRAEGAAFGNAWFRSYTALPDGRMLFGGSRGLLVVDPTRYRPWQYQPPLRATRLRIQGEDVPLARLSPRLRLSPAERSFALEFVAMDLSQPQRNRYRYRLDGLDADWIETDGAHSRQASYGGLAPGRYLLQVQGSNRSGAWSPKGLELEIEVLPAWWQTWWARAAAVLLTLAGLVAVVQARTARLRRHQTELEARVQERTLALHQLSEALQQKSQALEESALTDPLTGLRNRRFVTERLDDDLHLVLRQHEEAARQGLPPPPDADLCFFLIDLDHFKEVNDRFGHAAGDAVLVQMRERLQEVFREADYLVRWGGEEFLVVARGSNRQAAPLLAERACRAVIERPFLLPQGRTLQRSCSIGFACFPLQRAQPRAAGWALVVDLADAALYQAKHEGRNRWVGVLDGDALSPAALAEALRGLALGLPAGLQLCRGHHGETAPLR